MSNAINLTFSQAQVWTIIGAIAVFIFVLLWRVDKAVNNGMTHIYTAVQVTNNNVRTLSDNIQTVNNNVKSLATALKNHPGTTDLVYDWEDIPPLHGK